MSHSTFALHTLIKLIAATLVTISLSGGVSAEQHDCSRWVYSKESLDHFGTKLGSLTSSFKKLKPVASMSGPRFFDKLNVEAYLDEEQNTIIHAISCNDGNKLVVGIRSGGMIFGHLPIVWWVPEQKIELRKAGVADIREKRDDSQIFLWGVKSSTGEPGPDGVSEYVVLARSCMLAPDQKSVCGLAFWDVHLIRSR